MILESEFELKELKDGETSLNEKLLNIVGTSTASVGKRYLVSHHNKEVAFLSLDFPNSEEHKDYVVLYKVYVIPELRNNGIGKYLLNKTEEICEYEGRKKIKLHAHALDDKTSTEKLISWYKSNNYKIISNNDGITMEKIL